MKPVSGTMFSPILMYIALAAVIPSVLGQIFFDNFPATVVFEQPNQLSWSGGRHTCLITPGAEPNAAPLLHFPPQNGTTLTFIPEFPPGTTVVLLVRDPTGHVGQSPTITIIAPGTSTTCISSAASTGSGSSTLCTV
ncbi:hypothetical protein BDZ89DRAFT_780916 [Hymenopellis radicata]|nr:hypothetical protein BDZ89DRAFT_780916 [Hymenopellis radicata]